MLPRPRIRIPLTLAAGIVVALYFVRSAMRGLDWRVDSADVVVLIAFLVVLAIVAFVRRAQAREAVAGYSADDANRSQPRTGESPAE